MIRILLVLAIFTQTLAAQTARVEGIVRTVMGDPIPGCVHQLVNGPGNFLISPNGDQILAGFTAATDKYREVRPGRMWGRGERLSPARYGKQVFSTPV
jgi:hypothetical protein